MSRRPTTPETFRPCEQGDIVLSFLALPGTRVIDHLPICVALSRHVALGVVVTPAVTNACAVVLA